MVTIKNDLLIKIDSLRNAIENEDIDILIHLIDDMGFDNKKIINGDGFCKTNHYRFYIRLY